ncbi:MAG: methylmalonyl Co-A mutase-associated GTPase MeaB [Saprospiraceae bacterium]|nr:methylmalonyl Co-A mutase-associated GTPase MeaB [Saprospiraceae bacterium]
MNCNFARKSNMQSINPNLQFQRRRTPSVSEYVEGILQGNRVMLSQAITLIESTKVAHQNLAQQIIEQCLPHAGNSVRIGITGTPGVGKSTFIEALGMHITERAHQVAVLAIDPSSQMSRGSILGDKTRMLHLSANEKAFIRPSPAGDSLGGVARKTRESIVLCEAAGFNTIIVETVGVGQSETAVHSMTDFFLLLLLPGAGDELQGIKRGIVEMADLIAVNKADGDREKMAKQAKAFYNNALHLLPMKESRWTPQALTCSALSGLGVSDIWQLINDYQQFTKENQFFYNNRKNQSRYWLTESIESALHDMFYKDPSVSAAFSSIEKAVLEGQISSFRGAEALIQIFRDKKLEH